MSVCYWRCQCGCCCCVVICLWPYPQYADASVHSAVWQFCMCARCRLCVKSRQSAHKNGSTPCNNATALGQSCNKVLLVDIKRTNICTCNWSRKKEREKERERERSTTTTTVSCKTFTCINCCCIYLMLLQSLSATAVRTTGIKT